MAKIVILIDTLIHIRAFVMYRIIVAAAGLALLTGPASAETIERTVTASTISALGGFLGYEVNTCYPSVIPDVKVRQASANGTIQIRPHEQALGTNSNCPGTKVRGLAFVYAPNKGFKGG
jgi:hypothetical protein